jgi:Holliday junction resolvasome RuvABC endonuclease subunit
MESYRSLGWVDAVGVFVGLDLSLTSTGLAILDGNSAICHSFGYALKKSTSNAEKTKRYIDIASSVIHLLRPYESKIHTIVVEEYAFTQQIAYACELGGIIKSQIYLALRKSYVSIPSTTVRKILLGHAKKLPDIKDEVARKLNALGYSSFSNFDESDALALAYITRKILDKAVSKEEKKLADSFMRQKYGDK